METKEIFVPLAHRLGMNNVKMQYEDITFKPGRTTIPASGKVIGSTELQYNVMNELDIPIGGSFKMNYYSTNKFAEVIGYSPKYDSLEGVLQELSYILANKR